MRTEAFSFTLPTHHIADHPARPRDTARLLTVGGAQLSDHIVHELPRLLRAGDLLVFNDTRVIPAQLSGHRGTARIEITLHKRAEAGRWLAFARPGKRLRAGQTISFAPDFSAEVVEKRDNGEILLDFPGCNNSESALFAALHRYGRMPLPPYIRRPDGPMTDDAGDYQTLFAKCDGAVAAPTAGLHFTPELMAALTRAGIATTTVTLHVGAGTFLPVKVEDIADHHMHTESGEITPAAIAAISATRDMGGRVVAVGTTSLRLLETVAAHKGGLRPWAGETAIFITPGYRFQIADLLMTNFHLPRSTLFMLVSAFAGLERMHAAYAHAITHGYRFYSYGDACLLESTCPRETFAPERNFK
ncbi:MAG: tRNA preQ1(34) S-adenosylmethionine ribosyltransferase-isomerase QueA [Rhodospirillaceae bacterium]